MKLLYICIMLILLGAIVSADCTDTDSGKNKYASGTVVDPQGTYTDSCSDHDIKEYFCGVDGVASYTLLQCVNGCKENECQLANDAPVAAAPEVDTGSSNIKLYFYGIVILLMIGLYIYLTRFRSKRKSY